jgi:formate C-acetyltransferase
LALEWLDRRERACADARRTHALPPLIGELVVRSLHHLVGRRTAATPDGRHAGDPLADSVGAQLGTAREGPTALLNSVCKMDAARHWAGGYNLNLTLPLTSWTDPTMRDKLQSLVEVFFAQGGQELQINCVDPAMLRDAQKHPDDYPDLMVRIAGFNAFFTRLSPLEQNELIQRAEGCGG